MLELLDIITHNYDSRRGPFRNICALPRAKAQALLDDIDGSGLRSIKASYLERRLATERWLRAERERKFGPPQLANPIYFFLGNFADGKDPSRPDSIVIPLAELPAESLTFTYPDSMASLPLGIRPEHLAERRDHHGQVFSLDEIAAVVAHFGLPGESWRRDPLRRYDRFVEVQLWDGRPLARFLPSRH